jgi:Ca-activated chloride channel family protein
MIILRSVTADKTDKTYKLDELAAKAGVSARTVRYYVQRGLLSAPQFRGRDTVYTNDHLQRLKAIRRMQEQFLPLDQIQVELERGGGTGGADMKVTVPPPIMGHPYRVPPIPTVPIPKPPTTRWRRYVLRDGLELHVSEGADDETHKLADELIMQTKGDSK